MSRSFSGLMVVLCGCATVMACGDGGAGSRALERSSWDVTLKVTITDQQQAPTDGRVYCPSLAFTMHLEPQAAGLGVTWGANGQVIAGGPLVRKPGGEYTLAAPARVPDNAGCAISEPMMTQLAFRAADTDGDGVGDRITGTGTGKGTWRAGDLIYNLTLSFELAGTPDVTPPRLTAPGMVHPLGRVSVLASEPLLPPPDLRLEGTSSVSLAPSQVVDGAVGAFSTEVILPFSGAWTVTGVASDLIGLSIGEGPTVKTLADPGIFTDGGFEGSAPLVADVTGDVDVVAGLGTVPALGGGHSLLVRPRASVTFHLTRPPGASSVRLNVRGAAKYLGGYFGSQEVRVGVIGGLMRHFPMLPPNAAATTETGDPEWPFVTPSAELVQPLVDEGDDIVVQIAPFPAPGCSFGSLCAPVSAVLIDDIRVE